MAVGSVNGQPPPGKSGSAYRPVEYPARETRPASGQAVEIVGFRPPASDIARATTIVFLTLTAIGVVLWLLVLFIELVRRS